MSYSREANSPKFSAFSFYFRDSVSHVEFKAFQDMKEHATYDIKDLQ